MILFFSGTCNSRYVAQRLGKALRQQTYDLFRDIRTGAAAALESEQPWVLVAPTYAWRIPRVVENWLARAALAGSRDLYVVMTCGDGIGHADKYLKPLCARKGLCYRGVAEIVMPENYLAMFSTPAQEEALQIIDRAEGVIDRAADCIRRGEPFPAQPVTLADRAFSAVVNPVFYPLFVHAKPFAASDKCVSCGKCAALCPLNNVQLKDGKPVWGKRCTHCMACISHCPTQAIEYGSRSKGKPRYLCPKNA